MPALGKGFWSSTTWLSFRLIYYVVRNNVHFVSNKCDNLNNFCRNFIFGVKKTIDSFRKFTIDFQKPYQKSSLQQSLYSVPFLYYYMWQNNAAGCLNSINITVFKRCGVKSVSDSQHFSLFFFFYWNEIFLKRKYIQDSGSSWLAFRGLY